MPSEELRVGDKVRMRVRDTVPIALRDKRATIAHIQDGRYRLVFASPPSDSSGNPYHAMWWTRDHFRVIARGPVIEVGTRVQVADQPYSDYENGYVDSALYGAVGVVADVGRMSVTVRIETPGGGGTTNYIHPYYLTVIEQAPAPGRFSVGDLVQVAPDAVRSTVTGQRVNSRIAGQVCQVSVTNHPHYEVRTLNGVGFTGTVHVSGLSPAAEDVIQFRRGHVVQVAEGALRSLGGRPAAVAGQIGIVYDDVITPRVVTAMGTGYVHQSFLSTVETPTLEPGMTVRVGRQAFISSSDTGNLRMASDRLYNRIGRIAPRITSVIDPGGNVRVRVGGSTEWVHWAFLTVLSEEEAANTMVPGMMARVSMTSQSGRHIPVNVRGRVVTVAEDYGDGSFYVEANGRGEQVWQEDMTRIVQAAPDQRSCWHCTEIAEPHFTVNSEVLCQNCTEVCGTCSQVRALRRMHLIDERFTCSDCSVQCQHCGGVNPRSDARVNSDGYWYCPRHWRQCRADGCEALAFGMQATCQDCQTHVGYDALGRWRRTEAVLWLGGPVRSKGGYYVGFEHEVTASGMFNLRPLREWANENLGHRTALDPKPDSSVSGFEIATQPMTPAFFESVDWESYMAMLNENYPVYSEPEGHGLHVHIGRQAFRRERLSRYKGDGTLRKKPKRIMVTDPAMLAAFTLLLSRGHSHLTRIGRRDSARWAERVTHPVKATIVQPHFPVRGKQHAKITRSMHVAVPRGAVNLTNQHTIEIRVARSTRSADDLRDAVRVVYLAAEYIRHLRSQGSINPKAVNWMAFSEWVREVMPEAHQSISGSGVRLEPHPVTTGSLMEAFTTEESEALRAAGTVNTRMEEDGEVSAPFVTLGA